MKRAAGNLLLVLLTLVVCVVAAEFAARMMWPGWREFQSNRFLMRTQVPGMGETIIGTPGFSGFFAENNGDFRVAVDINAFGVREPEPIEAADGRVWVVGDSFSFGWGVEHDQTFAARTAARTGVAVYNIANPGTNVCGYQRSIARVPDDIRPRAVIVGLTMENDISPQVCAEAAPPPAESGTIHQQMAIKGYMTMHSALYNLAAYGVKRNETLRTLLGRLGIIADVHVDRAGLGDAKPLAVMQNTTHELVRLREMLADGLPVIVLMIPTRFEILERNPAAERSRVELSAMLTDAGFTVVNVADELRAAGFDTVFFQHDGHWSPAGHEIAAKALAAPLAQALAQPQ